MSYPVIEPEACAVRDIAALLRAVRIVPRRAVVNELLGAVYQSEIAFPGEPGYDEAGATAALFKSVREHSTLGALTQVDNLPAAWVFPSDQAMVEELRLGDQLAGIEIGVHVKGCDPKEDPDTAVALKHRIVDLLRRVRLERLADLGPTDAQKHVGRWSTTYSADGRHQHHDAPIVLVFRDKQRD